MAQDWIGRKVKFHKDGRIKHGVIEYLDDKWIVVFCERPRKERIVFANDDTFQQKVKVLES